MYFSRAGENYGVGVVEEGNTAIIAKMIAEKTGAELFEVVPSNAYPEGYDECCDVALEEQNAGARPTFANDIDIAGYDTIYLGYPIWWGEEPRILCTFVEQYDFTGITVVPFCTSGGSGIGRSGDDLAKLAGSGERLKGARHSGGISEKKLKTWVKGLNK